MIHGCVTLDEVFAAAAVRAASLVPETSGYLALAVGDATSRLPFAIDDRNVMLTTEGNVGITKRGEVLPPKQAAAGMRDILGRLLAVSTGTAMPALAHAGKPRDESDRGVDAVVEEIEAALIPVNRAAARRALARLARETIKAKELGKVKPRSSTRPPPAPNKPEPPKVEAEAPKPVPEPAKAATPRPAKVETPRPAKAATPKPARAATPKPVAAAPAPAAPSEPEMVVAHAKTPPPIEAAPIEAAPAAIEPEPIEAAPEPIEAAPASLEAVPLYLESAPLPRFELPPPAEPTPAPAVVDPTPTVLGMGEVHFEYAAREPEPAPVEVAPEPSEEPETVALPVEPDEETRRICDADRAPALAPAIDPALSPIRVPELAEPAVLHQPTEPAELAFELTPRPRPIAEPITPPFALEPEPEPRVMPVARPTAAEPQHGALGVAATPGEVAAAHTRADDLLARFGASCVDDEGVHAAAACLRRMTGVDPTPPPRVEVRVRRVPVEPEAESAELPSEAETPMAPRARPRSRSSVASFALTVAVLLLGVAGGGTLVRMRPDLFGMAHGAMSPPSVAAPRVAAPREDAAAKTPAAPIPAATAEPQGAVVPTWTPSVGTRAQR